MFEDFIALITGLCEFSVIASLTHQRAAFVYELCVGESVVARAAEEATLVIMVLLVGQILC